jgi:hypothetical protein
VQDSLKGKLGATERESRNVEVRRNNIHKSVPDIIKVGKKSRKPWIT